MAAALVVAACGQLACVHATSGTRGEWRPPTAAELDEEWRRGSSTRFVVAYGDYDGDGQGDEARLVLSQDGRRVALVAKLSRSGDRVVFRSEPMEHPLTRLGIVTLPPDKYATACGKGAFECEPREPEELVMRWDGIDFFHEESADGVYYMVEPGKEYVFIRLFD